MSMSSNSWQLFIRFWGERYMTVQKSVVTVPSTWSCYYFPLFPLNCFTLLRFADEIHLFGEFHRWKHNGIAAKGSESTSFWTFFMIYNNLADENGPIKSNQPIWRFFDWLLTKTKICLRVATETKSTKTQFSEEIVLSYQRAAQNKPKNVKNTYPTCLALEELLPNFLTTARTNAWFQEFTMFAPDLERPKCNSGGNHPFLPESYPSTAQWCEN